MSGVLRKRIPPAAGRAIRAVVSSFWFKLVLSAAMIAVLIARTDIGRLWGILSRSHASWVLLALAGFELSQGMSAARWCLLARIVGFHDRFHRFLAYYFSGMYMNLFAPSTVAGDVGRALFLARGTGRRALALSSVVADRGLGFVALIWVASLAIISQPQYPLPHLLTAGAWIAPALTLAAWRWGPTTAVRLLPLENRWRRMVEHDLAAYRHDHRRMALPFLLAVSFHLVQVATQVWLARALGLDVAWTYFLVFVPVANAASMLPITVGGIGVRESCYLYFLSQVGVGSETAVALGLLSSAIVLVTAASGAPAFLFLPRAKNAGVGASPLTP